MKYINVIELSSVRIPVRSGNCEYYINLLDISHIVSEENYPVIHLKCGKTITDSKTIGEYETMLSEYDIFCRVHNSCIVNIMEVEHRQAKNRKEWLIMKNNKTILLSKSGKKKFLSAMSVLFPEKHKKSTDPCSKYPEKNTNYRQKYTNQQENGTLLDFGQDIIVT